LPGAAEGGFEPALSTLVVADGCAYLASFVTLVRAPEKAVIGYKG
jgi:hypothetical protein